MSKKRSKGSRRANLEIRIRRISNGSAQRRPDSTVHVLQGDRIVRMTAAEYQALDDEISGLEYFAGESLRRPVRIS